MYPYELIGHVYAGVDVFTGKNVAIKFEPASLDYRLLEHEAMVYERLVDCPYVPRLHWFGTDYDCDIIVLDLLGPSLETLFAELGRGFPVRTVLVFGIDLVRLWRCAHRLHLTRT